MNITDQVKEIQISLTAPDAVRLLTDLGRVEDHIQSKPLIDLADAIRGQLFRLLSGEKVNKDIAKREIIQTLMEKMNNITVVNDGPFPIETRVASQVTKQIFDKLKEAISEL